MGDSTFSLVYSSLPTQGVSEEEVRGLIHKSRIKNRELDITGVLLFNDTRFIQLLEGPEAVVRKLFDTIAQDDRHHSVLVLFEFTSEERVFPDWSMGMKSRKEADLLQFGPQPQGPFAEPDEALRLIRHLALTA